MPPLILLSRHSEVYPLHVREVLLVVVLGDVLLPVGAVHILDADTHWHGMYLLHSDVGSVRHTLILLIRVERSGCRHLAQLKVGCHAYRHVAHLVYGTPLHLDILHLLLSVACKPDVQRLGGVEEVGFNLKVENTTCAFAVWATSIIANSSIILIDFFIL